ncbi:PLP-dependent transferase [Xylaria arbuscula]|nr:PLP-dependent transferase [Xylaria arbuscula]
MMSPNRYTGGLEATLQGRLAQRESQGRLRQLITPRTDLVDFSSNDYLSLSQDLDLRNDVIAHLTNPDINKQQQPSPSSNGRTLGSGGSRLLDGNSDFVEYLEKKISKFHGSEAALLFNSAYDANVGLISCVPGYDDVIIYDNLIHASIHDGMRLSRATKRIPFEHSSIVSGGTSRSGINDPGTTDCHSLEGVLRQLTEVNEDVRSGKSNVFICIEALYSMDGDVADLEYVSAIVKSLLPHGNGYVIVDEAHSVGVLGDGGRGLVCQLGLEDQTWVRVLGFGKAVGCAGGAILCSSITRLYLINYARTLIYTTAMSFPSLTSINAAYDFLMTGKADQRQNQLKTLVEYCQNKLKSLGHDLQPAVAPIRMLEGHPSSSPIIPLFTNYPKSLARYCQRSGFMVRPIVAPTVPLGQERIRICLHATNTTEQIDNLCRVIETWARECIQDGERNQTQVVTPNIKFQNSPLEIEKPKL